jgi:hypothetical protein
MLAMGVAAGLATAAATGCTVPAGPEGEIVYDAHHNSRFVRWLYDRQGWRPWTCRYALGR